MEKKQTAVSYFAEIDTQLTIDFLEGKLNQIQYAYEKMNLLIESKKLEKEQIINAYCYGKYINVDDRKFGEKFYTDNYGQ